MRGAESGGSVPWGDEGVVIHGLLEPQVECLLTNGTYVPEPGTVIDWSNSTGAFVVGTVSLGASEWQQVLTARRAQHGALRARAR
jgi:hypothetical protein